MMLTFIRNLFRRATPQMEPVLPPPLPQKRYLSDEGKALIKKFEGLKLKAYKCPAGKWTIGYGHTATAHNGMVIDQAYADLLFIVDVGKFEDAVSSAVKVPLTQGQFDALVSFTYNVGAPALKRSTLLRRLNEGDYACVPDQLARWNKVGGIVSTGLVRRRKAEAVLWAQA